ncbi:MAG: type III-A CRISPR-associated RAMP protein Csm4 [Candidatus Nitrosocaldus sp.]
MREHSICILRVDRLHIGLSVSLEATDIIIHSDTIFNGICWAYNELYGKEALYELLADSKEKRLIISSAFPLSNNTYYFPKPLNLSYNEIGNDSSNRYKTLKKARFISKDLFEHFINEGTLPIDESRDEAQSIRIDNIFIHKESEHSPSIHTSIEYRNRLDRLSYYSDIYRCGYTILRNCAYWFAYHTSDEDKIRAALRLLADDGIGGERSIGLGRSSIEFTSINIDEPEASDSIVVLSLYHPTIYEASSILHNYKNTPSSRIAYSLTTRGGWTDPRLGSIRKKRLRMFEEGSVLPLQPYAIHGNIVNVNDESKPVYHYGLCYSIGMRSNKGGR